MNPRLINSRPVAIGLQTKVIKYYRCFGCNLTFKTLSSAMDHKAATLHGNIKEEQFASRFDPFPQIDSCDTAGPSYGPPHEDLPIGEPVEQAAKKEFYVCLSCRLTFKTRASSAEHKAGSRHIVVRENYPIGPSYPTTFGKMSEVIGSNIDYDAFFQRTLDDVPNEN